MTLMKYEPSSILNRVRDQLNYLSEPDLLQSFFDNESNFFDSNWMPSVDIKEEDKNYIFYVDIPGVDPDDIEITSENGTLIIKGERHSDTEEEKEGYTRIERKSGNFYRRFTLPVNVDINQISAKSKNGVLEIMVPKTKPLESKKIKIK